MAEGKTVTDNPADTEAPPPPKVKRAIGEFAFTGQVGQPFAIYGRSLGETGTVTIGGQEVKTTSWRENSIRGLVPDDLKPGKVVVKVNERTLDAVI